MSKSNRATLKKQFASGQRPTGQSFGDLIDSMVNIADDGFNKTSKDGMLIARLDEGSRLVGFCDKSIETDPLWSIGFNQSGADSGGNLKIYPSEQDGPGLTLVSIDPEAHDLADGDSSDASSHTDTPDKASVRLGINTDKPEHELDVDGVVAAHGRIGRPGQVLADGNWNTVLKDLKGCHAFEIMAGVGGGPQSGKYALLHAFAVCAFDPKKGNITAHQAHYGSRCHRIELRWVGNQDRYALEMRTGCSYQPQGGKKDDGTAPSIYIRYSVTNLWFDPTMSGSVQQEQDSASS